LTTKQCYAIIDITKHCSAEQRKEITVYISKKELLSVTGISYGQLYRWKREDLIPTEWFIKQASYTGQETFFPKDKILNRIEFIMKMKDDYSLEAIAQMISSDVPKEQLTFEKICKIEEINAEIVNLYKREEYDYIEVIYMCTLSQLYLENKISLDSIKDLMINTLSYIQQLSSTNYLFTVYSCNSSYYGLIYKDETQIFIDKRHKVQVFNMDDIANEIKRKYDNMLNLNIGEKL